jgi:deoxyribodipyrimidine photolyase
VIPRCPLQRFLSARLKSFDELRNNPTQPGATSNLSPYLHFGE